MQILVWLLFAVNVYALKVNLRAIEHKGQITRESRATMLARARFHYVIDVGVGKYDSHWYTLLVESGSWMTYIGTDLRQPYIGSASSHQTNVTFQARYVTGQFVSGVWAQDQTMIAPGLVVRNTHFGIATRVGRNSLTTADSGMFALGPQSGLDIQTGSRGLSTWMTAATSEGVIPNNIVTVDLGEPSLTFGHVNLENAVGQPVYLPSIGAMYWIVQMSFPQIALNGPVLVDTAAAYLSLTPASMQILMSQIPGSRLDTTFDHLLLIPYGRTLKPFTIVIGDREFVLSSEKQFLNQPYLREPPGFRYSIFHQMGYIPKGVGAIFGGKVQKHFVIILDDDKHRVGFAARTEP